ncbi:MAG TPA: hypothetical protein VGK32_06255 [Vicinamibacterales bacterium]
MSPRSFWNHPLEELARSLVHTFGPGESAHLSTDEFVTLLGRLVGTTAQGPALIAQSARPQTGERLAAGRKPS